MSEWWTYRPSDLLMFSPRTWWRLFELHNEAWWPLHALTVVMALVLAGALWRGNAGVWRAGVALLAAFWALVAWTFLWQRYAPILPAAMWFAIGFGLQAALLLALSIHGGTHLVKHKAVRATGLGLLAWAVLLHPWLAGISSRPWAQAEVFGVAPDPTAIGTLGVLLCLAPRGGLARGLLGVAWLVAVLWCAISAATLWTMGSPQGWVPAVAAAVALTALARRRD